MNLLATGKDLQEKNSPLVLDVRGLKTFFKTRSGIARAVDGLSFSIPKASTYALVGESGCGKSVTALSIIQLIQPPAGYSAGGSVLLNGIDLVPLSERQKREIRGSRVSMIFQEPMTSLNPVFTVGEQIVEAIRYHSNASVREAKARTIEMLSKVQFPEPETVFNEYPHRLSGGMRQRAMIAMALCLMPDLLIADEPTTALDVTIQEEIIRLIRELKESLGTAVLLITHNLGLVYNNADFIGVMYAGKLVEEAGAKELFKNPLHPYTLKLLRSVPDVSKRSGSLDTIPGAVPPATSYPEGCRFSGRCQSEMQGCAKTEPLLKETCLNVPAPACLRPGFEAGIGKGHKAACHLYDRAFMASPDSTPLRRAAETPFPAASRAEAPPLTSILSPLGRGSIRGKELILEVRDLKTYYPVKKGLFKRTTGYVKAVDGISFGIRKGMTLALVGESGCGKTTAGKTILRLIEPASGEIVFKGRNLTGLNEKAMKPVRSMMQIIFQDPYSSLNPRLTVRDIIKEGIMTVKPGLNAKERFKKAANALERVGLDATVMDRYPHEFSGGQRQRICIARALAVDPEFIVCDEATSALDVSVQAQILNLLKSIQRDTGLSYLFITHDLGVVEYMADEVAVMHMGRIVEHAEAEKLFSNPSHEYTARLLKAVPKIGV